jgi:hypothetical protein
MTSSKTPSTNGRGKTLIGASELTTQRPSVREVFRRLIGRIPCDRHRHKSGRDEACTPTNQTREPAKVRTCRAPSLDPDKGPGRRGSRCRVEI